MHPDPGPYELILKLVSRLNNDNIVTISYSRWLGRCPCGIILPHAYAAHGYDPGGAISNGIHREREGGNWGGRNAIPFNSQINRDT